MTQLVRWEPFRELNRIRTRLDRMLDEGVGGAIEHEDGVLRSDWMPSVDVFEGDVEIQLRAELPGLTEKDISIEVEGDRVILKGEKSKEHTDEGEANGHYRRVESYYGSFFRSFPLPPGVDASKIDATMKNGVLHVTLPKTEAAKPHKVKIKAT
jgi:HSP20 family protein